MSSPAPSVASFVTGNSIWRNVHASIYVDRVHRLSGSAHAIDLNIDNLEYTDRCYQCGHHTSVNWYHGDKNPQPLKSRELSIVWSIKCSFCHLHDEHVSGFALTTGNNKFLRHAVWRTWFGRGMRFILDQGQLPHWVTEPPNVDHANIDYVTAFCLGPPVAPNLVRDDHDNHDEHGDHDSNTDTA